jgi:hypothetical protein
MTLERGLAFNSFEEDLLQSKKKSPNRTFCINPLIISTYKLATLKMSPNCRQQGAFLCFYMHFSTYKKA